MSEVFLIGNGEITRLEGPRGETPECPEARFKKREVFVPDWVWTCRTSDGHVTKSHWLPDETRWNGYTRDAGPDLWQRIVVPEPPEAGLGEIGR